MTKDPRDVLDRAADFERRAALLDSQARIRAWLDAGGLPAATPMPHVRFGRNLCGFNGCYDGHTPVDVFSPLFPVGTVEDIAGLGPVMQFWASLNDFEALFVQLYELGPHRVKIGFAVGGAGDDLVETAEAADLLHPLFERLIRFLTCTPKKPAVDPSIVKYPPPRIEYGRATAIQWIRVGS